MRLAQKLIFTIIVGIIFSFCTQGFAKNKTAEKPTCKAGELLVKFKSGYEGKGSKAINQMGATVIARLSQIDVSRIKLPEGMGVAQAKKQLSKLPFVQFAEPNFINLPNWQPSDPKWETQWGIQKIKTAAAWSVETGKSTVIIAIVDSGVDLNHPDLKSKLVKGYDVIKNNNYPDDQSSHGTHCAGIAAAQTNNAKGIAGVCPNCSIMPIRVLGPKGGYSSDVANGIMWAVDHGAQVISLSLGSPYASQTEQEAINYAWNKGALIVAAAGNEGTKDYYYPAYFKNCIAVGATTSADTRAKFSNYGSWVNVAAPGEMILSTVPNGNYIYKSGTSMATPFVAGLAGLIFSELGSNATNTKVRFAIENNIIKVGNWVATGRIDVKAAINSVKGMGSSAKPKPSAKPKQNKSGNSQANKNEGFAPSGFKKAVGSIIKAPSNSAVYSDDKRLVLRSSEQGKQRTLDFVFNSKVKNASSAKSLKIILEAKFYSAKGIITAYLWNWKKQKWDWIGKQTLDTTDKKVTFSRGYAATYISKNNDIRVRFYRKTKYWETFEMGTDYIRFNLSTK